MSNRDPYSNLRISVRVDVDDPALSRNSTQCPIGAGFTISSFRSPSVAGRPQRARILLKPLSPLARGESGAPTDARQTRNRLS
jgi:hypothetical protein